MEFSRLFMAWNSLFEIFLECYFYTLTGMGCSPNKYGAVLVHHLQIYIKECKSGSKETRMNYMIHIGVSVEDLESQQPMKEWSFLVDGWRRNSLLLIGRRISLN